jgi:hypothetical protein
LCCISMATRSVQWARMSRTRFKMVHTNYVNCTGKGLVSSSDCVSLQIACTFCQWPSYDAMFYVDSVYIQNTN